MTPPAPPWTPEQMLGMADALLSAHGAGIHRGNFAAMLRQAAAASEREAALREEIASYQRTIQQEYDKREALDAEIARLTQERDELHAAIWRREKPHADVLSLAKAHRSDSESVDAYEASREEAEAALAAERQKVKALREWIGREWKYFGSHKADRLLAHMDKCGLVVLRTSQGQCETTITERFNNPDCVCPTYEGNLGPCATYEAGGNGRCVYCDHNESCHLICLGLSLTEPTPPQEEK